MSPGQALALAPPKSMEVKSELLGPLDVDPAEVLRFPNGLFGFPECQGFVLASTENPGLFWLQSTEHPALAFLLADPFALFPEYAVELSASDLHDLRVEDRSEVAILAIVTLPRTRGERPTANLQGPVGINLRARVGRQLAIDRRDWGVRRPFDLAG